MRKQIVKKLFCIFAFMKYKFLLIIAAFAGLLSCQDNVPKTVICIPVYGQSLALGIETELITDFDSLANYAGGRIITENCDHQFGYYDLNKSKLFVKKLFHYQKQFHELTVYSMAQFLADNTGKDTLICIFPGGTDGTIISELGQGSLPYQKLIYDIKTAYQRAKKKGWTFEMPALCWMQGETDVNSYPGTNYRNLLLQLYKDINHDVKTITGQKKNVEFICYQTNQITRAKHFNPLSFNCIETIVPQTQLELVRDNPNFHASGPTYPYNCVNDIIHIDGLGQQEHGILVAKAALDILREQKHKRGLFPNMLELNNKKITISFNVPCPPLVFDTILVSKADYYGFSVITTDNRNIIESVSIEGSNIKILCSEPIQGCRIRYAVNGEYMKSGRKHGPRGNLRDSQGEILTLKSKGKVFPIHNWCYQFDIPTE